MDPMGMVNVSLSNLWSLAVMTCESHWTTGNLVMAVGCSWHGIRPLTCAECSHVCFCLLRSVPAPAVPGVLWKLMSCWRCWLDGNSMWRGMAAGGRWSARWCGWVMCGSVTLLFDAVWCVLLASPLRRKGISAPPWTQLSFLQIPAAKNHQKLFRFVLVPGKCTKQNTYSYIQLLWSCLPYPKMI